ncbi:hypothetical protein [Kribbella ginsengisoli]|uniref:Uncharacterized protein n=1 Tax=Kribbella ginsengisoli TaxID=363865 RepID=A0ABP6XT25_9ACTN
MQTHSRRTVLGFAAAAVAAPIVLSAGQASASGTLTFAQSTDAWTQINQARASTSYWAFDRDRAKAGLEFGGSGLWRSMFRFSIAELAAGVIESVSFSIVLDHTPGPNPTPVELWSTAPIDPDVPVTWNTFAGSWLGLVASASGAAYPGAGQPDQKLTFSIGPDVVQQAVDVQHQFVTLGLRAPNEGDRLQWKKLYGDSAKLEVTYHR